MKRFDVKVCLYCIDEDDLAPEANEVNINLGDEDQNAILHALEEKIIRLFIDENISIRKSEVLLKRIDEQKQEIK